LTHAAWAWNLHNGYVHWSPQLEALHGLPPGSFPGTPEAVEAFLHPDDRSRVVGALARAIEQRTPVLELEYRILRLDGGIRRIQLRSLLLTNQSGTPALMTGRCTDVAFDERPSQLRNISLRLRCQELARRSREAFGLLVEGNPDGLLMRRGDTILFANNAFARLVGFDEGSALAGRSLLDLVTPEQHGMFSGGGPVGAPARLRLLRRDGTEVDASVEESGRRQFDGGVAVVAVVRRFEQGAEIEEKAMAARELLRTARHGAQVLDELSVLLDDISRAAARIRGG
jgi:PAS domain-containing protein